MGAIPPAGIDFHLLLDLTRDSVMVLKWDGTIALWGQLNTTSSLEDGMERAKALLSPRRRPARLA